MSSSYCASWEESHTHTCTAEKKKDNEKRYTAFTMAQQIIIALLFGGIDDDDSIEATWLLCIIRTISKAWMTIEKDREKGRHFGL